MFSAFAVFRDMINYRLAAYQRHMLCTIHSNEIVLDLFSIPFCILALLATPNNGKSIDSSLQQVLACCMSYSNLSV